MNQPKFWFAFLKNYFNGPAVLFAQRQSFGGGANKTSSEVTQSCSPGGPTQESFIRGGSAPRSKPLPFYIPFLREKVPLLYTFCRKFYPFHITIRSEFYYS